MWRAYGGNPNVAIIFDILDLIEKNNKIRIYASPVFYGDQTQLEAQFACMLQLIKNNAEKLKKINKSELADAIAWKFHCSTLSIKHPGFSEEKEWRIIYSPSIHYSKELKDSIEIISGVPQIVMILDIIEMINNSDSKMGLTDLINKIIIGPTQDTDTIIPAIARALGEWGVDKPFDRIKSCGIPLRR